MISVKGLAASRAGGAIEPFAFERRAVGKHDVLIAITHCGICHSDIHQARDEWGGGVFPMVPGHEIVGTVTQVGTAVKKFKVGDVAGVGCFVDSCRTCDPCKRDSEQYCEKGPAFTYNSTEMDKKTRTFGGYSNQIVVDEKYTLRVPAALDRAGVAPLLCAGITTYSPLRRWNVGKGSRVAVLGLGGLGHMAVKLAAAMQAEVTVLSSSKHKQADAKRLGAHHFALTSDKDSGKKLAKQFDLIVNTVSAPHDVDACLDYLRVDGTMVMLGVPPEPIALDVHLLVMTRRQMAGSLIGGIHETQEMLDFCAQHGVVADVETIGPRQVNEAFDRVVKNDVKYRFVIDMQTL